MEAAGRIALAGHKVSLVEKKSETGGNLQNWYHLFPDRKDSREVLGYLKGIIKNENLRLLTGSSIENIEKSKGRFLLKTGKGEILEADAVVVATGFDLFRSERKEEYGYGIYDNVISSADLEKMFLEGPVKLKDGSAPGKIGMVHCVGSRDEKSGNLYCSKLCCVTAVKQAIEIREKLPASKVFCFYMDMRMGGAHYEELYLEAQEKHAVSFIRGKVSEVGEDHKGKLIVKVEDTLSGRPLRLELDMLVLMAGMEMAEGGRDLAQKLGLTTGENRFFQSRDNHFGSNLSNLDGVFYAGTCTAPMSIPETISHARAAVTEVIEYLKESR